MGISYGGFTALQVATHRPPHLTSIIPVDVTDDRYTDDCHYRGGLLRMYYDLGWYGTRMIAWNAMPPDRATFGDRWADVWRRHVDEDEPYLLAWLRHQVDGEYWRTGSVAGILDRIVCPTFLIGGWRDGYPNPPLRLFAGLSAPKRLLMGPWDHAYPDAAIPGPRIDHLREVVRWLDHWNRGIDDGLMDEPPIAVYVMEPGTLAPDRLDEPGEWRAERAWPPAGGSERVLTLGGEGRLVDGPVDAGEDRLLVEDVLVHRVALGRARPAEVDPDHRVAVPRQLQVLPERGEVDLVLAVRDVVHDDGQGLVAPDRQIHVGGKPHPVAHRDADVLHDPDVVGDVERRALDHRPGLR
jgi:putative CocE/NonD family hydrolase